jgi:hypothetical protein
LEDAADLFKKCALCGTVFYCSKTCQTAAWKAGHKRECAGKQQSKK